MPTYKGASNKTREKNIAAEIKSGMSPKQAVAVGYAMQRRAKGTRTGKHDVQHPRKSSHSGDK